MQVLTSLPSNQNDLETSKAAPDSKTDAKAGDFTDIFAPKFVPQSTEKSQGHAQHILDVPDFTELMEHDPSKVVVDQELQGDMGASPFASDMASPVTALNVKGPKVEIGVGEQLAGNATSDIGAQNATAPVESTKDANVAPFHGILKEGQVNIPHASQEGQIRRSEHNIGPTELQSAQNTPAKSIGETLSITRTAQNGIDHPKTTDGLALPNPKASAAQANSGQITSIQNPAPAQLGNHTNESANQPNQTPPNQQTAAVSHAQNLSESKGTKRLESVAQSQETNLESPVLRRTNTENTERAIGHLQHQPKIDTEVISRAQSSTPTSNTLTSLTQSSTGPADPLQGSEKLDPLEFQETASLRRLPDLQSSAQFRSNANAPLIEQVKPEVVLNRISSSLEATIARGSAGSYELRLHPIELGTVRILVSHSETGLTAVVSAERPEVLDLLRRHGDSLLNDLRNSADGNVEMSFKNSSNDGQQKTESHEAYAVSLTTENVESDDTNPNYIADRGLDIRL